MNSLLIKEPLHKLIFKYSIPCTCALLVSSLYNIVGQIFIGQGISYVANGATNVVFPIMTLCVAFSLLVGDGYGAYLSICQGQGNIKKSKRTIANAVVLVVGLSLFIAIFCFLFCDRILWMLGGTSQNFDYAKTYFQTIICGFPSLMLTNAMASIIRANGSPGFSMISTVVGCLINIVLDPIAIFVFDLGILGVGIATVIGQIVTSLFCIYYLVKKVKIQRSDIPLDFGILKRSIPLGFSSFFTQVFILVITAVLNTVLVKYGSLSKYGPDIPLTAIGIIMKVYNIVVSFVVGLAAGIQPIVGFNYGAKQFNRVKETYKLMIRYEIIIGIVATIVFEIFTNKIVSLFGNGGALYSEFAVYAFRVYFSTVLLCCLQKSTSIFLQAMGKPLYSMILSMMRDFAVSVSVVYLLAALFGVKGVPYCAPISDIISFVVVIYMMRFINKHLKIEEELTRNES